MTALIIQSIVLVAAVFIVIRAEPALNRMQKGTPILVRLSFLLITLGAVAEIMFVLAGDVPSWSTAIITVGIAALLFCERRLRVLCPPNKRSMQ